LKLAFWLAVDFVIGILMLVFGDPGTQFAALGVIGILLVTVVVLILLAAAGGAVWGIESLFPHSGARLEALAADAFLVGFLSILLANLRVPWNPILVAYIVAQLPLVLFRRSLGQFLAGVDVVHSRTQPRSLGGTLLEEAVLQLSVIEAIVVVMAWMLRRLPAIEPLWADISTRDRTLRKHHSAAHGLAAVLALVLVGVGACGVSAAPSYMASQAVYNGATACEGGEPAHPPTCLVEAPATVLDVHADITRDANGNVIQSDTIYYVQVSVSGQPQSLSADTTQGTSVIDSLYVGENVTAGLWDGALVLVRSEAGDVWEDGMRPGESSGAWLLWLGLGVVAVGLVLGAAIRIGRG
jgi:hypothetical protein